MASGSGDWFAVSFAASVVLASVVLAASVLTDTIGSGSASERAPAGPSAEPGIGPLVRDPSALMLAESSGDVLVGLAARPGGPVDLHVAASGGEKIAASSLRVRLGDRTVRVPARTGCPLACFRLAAPVLDGSPSRLSVELARPGKRSEVVRFTLPGRPPAPGAALMRAVGRTMGGLRSVAFVQTLSSGAATVRAQYVMQAPDRMRLEADSGWKTVIIGRKRWDWQGGRWIESTFPGLRAPNFPWAGASRARIIGDETVDGVRVRVVSLFKPDPRFPAWFRVFATTEGRVLRTEMIAPGHFMVDRYSRFDEPVRIEPPK